jgi:hypothetical protein
MRRQYFDYRPRTQFTVRGDRLEQMAPISLSRRLSSRWPNRRLALLAERTREASNRGPRFGRTNPRNRDRCRTASGGLVRPSRRISSARQQLGNRDVLVDFVPMEANAHELYPRALCRARKQKARKRCERDAERAAIAQLDPHRVLVKVHRHGREVHGGPVSCTPWCRRRCRI